MINSSTAPKMPVGRIAVWVSGSDTYLVTGTKAGKTVGIKLAEV